ncbi:MAG: M56 family metallopeptidase, partial [Terracidiphilus sp.]
MMLALLEAALRAILLAAAVGLSLRALHVRNVLARKAAWGLVLLSAAAMPALMRWPALPTGASLVVPLPQWPHAAESLPPKPGPAASALAPISAPSIVHPASSALPAEALSAPGPTPATPAPVAHLPLRPLDPAQLLRLVYLAVCALFLVRLLLGLGATLRIWLAARPVDVASLPPAARLAAQGIRLRSSRAVSAPINIGSGILLPAHFSSWDGAKLRIVLAHERSHIRQGDFYLQLLASLYAAVFWFSPLGWWLKRTLADLSETISDRAGLREAASRSSYARILLEFAIAPRLTLEGVAMARPSRLSERIEKLLNESTFRQA